MTESVTETRRALVDWPNTSGEHKVVQIYILEKPYLRFSDEKYDIPSHNGILLSTLEEFTLKYDPAKALMQDKRALQNDEYEAAGMGWADVDLEKRIATFFGFSVGYQIQISPQHIREISPLIPEWELVIGDLLRFPKKTY